MSDRQTPTSVMDRARACILDFRGDRKSARIIMSEIDLCFLAREIHPDSLTDIRRPRVRLTPAQHRGRIVMAARKGELYLWGVPVVIDDSSDSVTCEGAARGAEEYRADQHAGVANSVQAAQGCRLAAGAEGGADLCPLGTADVVSAALDWLEGPELPALPHAHVFLRRPLFVRMMQLHGVEPSSIPKENGQRYWDWVGGGIRYWDGWREMPRG